jgi:hypothetical protein
MRKAKCAFIRSEMARQGFIVVDYFADDSILSDEDSGERVNRRR